MNKQEATKRLFTLCCTEWDTDEMLQEMRHLIEKHHADIHRQVRTDWAPIHFTAMYGKAKSCQLLLEKGANVNEIGRYGHTPLHSAATNGHLELARLLVESGAHVNAQDSGKATPLFKAAWAGNLEICQFLLQHGADVRIGDDTRHTALHLAAFKGNHKISKLLLEHGADIDARNNEGNTPLHLAVNNQNWQVAKDLLEAGANPDIENLGLDSGYRRPSDCRNVRDFVGMLKESGWTPPMRTLATPSQNVTAPPPPLEVVTEDSPHVQQLKNARAKLRGFERPESDDLGRTPGGRG